MTSAILWLSDIGKDDIVRVGGKGTNLGELFRAGFPVPRAFCVTASAYQRHLESTGMGSMPTGDPASEIGNIERWSEPLRTRLLTTPLFGPVEIAIRDAYRALGNTIPVAVRSSATAEDLPAASFAGQMDTFLGIRGEQYMLEAVRKCWASLWSDRAIRYRNENRIAHSTVAMAVVVQEMVQAEAAGVMFTVDPLTGDAANVTISASYGLGEALVAGQVTPDTYTVAKNCLSISQVNIGHKAVKVVPQENGTSVVSVPDGEQRKPCLPESQIKEIARIGLNIERHYGHALDIEWAVSSHHIYILQARAVTGLPTGVSRKALKIPDRAEKVYGWIYLDRIPRPARRVFPNFARDHFPFPLRPFDIDTTLASALAGVRRVAAEISISMPLDIAHKHASGLVLFNPPVPPLMKTLFRLPVIGRRVKSLTQYDPLREWTEIDEPHVRAMIPPARLKDLSDLELLQIIGQLNEAITELMYRRFRKYMAPGATANRRLSALLVKVAGRQSGELKQRLLGNLQHKTARCNRAMRMLASNAAHSPAVKELLKRDSLQGAYTAIMSDPRCAEFASQFALFLREYGFRTAMTMEPQPSYPAWRDDPDQALAIIGAMLRNPNTNAHNDQTHEEAYRASRAEVVRRLQDRPKQLAAFNWALETARGFVIARESSLYLLEEIVGRVRETADCLADRLVATHRLKGCHQIYHLCLDELNALLAGEKIEEIMSLTDQRQIVWEHMRDTWDRPSQQSKGRNQSLKGAAVSPGIAIGTVKVVRSASEFQKLKAGDILVCSTTTPAWTPLFSVAAGVVTDVGGVLSHAAIVAREYGIPAVMGCANATSILIDGEQIEVNGTVGTVQRLVQLNDKSTPAHR